MHSILVIGDALIDVNIEGEANRLSPEGPFPIINKQSKSYNLGAAANVAAQIAAADIPCILSFKHPKQGTEYDNLFFEMCYKNNIVTKNLEINRPDPMIIKERVWAGQFQICRIDSEVLDPVDLKTQDQWIQQIIRLIEYNDVGVVVFSDYNKGTLSDHIIYSVCDYCRPKHIQTILDPKRPTWVQLGCADLIKPNRAEVNMTALSAEYASAKLGNNTVLLNTLGKDGMKAYRDGNEFFSCPTEAQEVYNVCGCGDSVCAFLAMGMYDSLPLEHLIKSANKAASYTIKHKGCYILNKDEINECFNL